MTRRTVLTGMAATPVAAILPSTVPAVHDPVVGLYAEYLEAEDTARNARRAAEDIIDDGPAPFLFPKVRAPYAEKLFGRSPFYCISKFMLDETFAEKIRAAQSVGNLSRANDLARRWRPLAKRFKEIEAERYTTSQLDNPAYRSAEMKADALGELSYEKMDKVREAHATTIDGVLCQARIALDYAECQHEEGDGWIDLARNIVEGLETLAKGGAT